MENQYNYYNSDGMNGNGQSETPFHDDNGGQKHQAPHGKKPQKKIPKAVAVTGFALLFGVVSSGTFLASNVVGSKVLGLTGVTKTNTTATKAVSSNASLSKSSSVVTSDVSSIVENVMPSIVSITNMSVQQVQDFFGGVSQQQSESAGTGIIISQNDSELLVVTNNHVVESANSVTVSITGKEQVNAKLVGKDASSDLAVISVSKPDLAAAGVTDVTAAKFGNSDDMQVGETVIPIGNALGQGKTATLGIISAQNKEINIDGKKLTVIQTDAAINPGNSGGALVNTAGEVIGINTAKLSSSAVEGIGYAIPISSAKTIIETLMTNGTVDKPYLGIQGYTIDENFEKIYGINIPGVFISKVEANSAAEQAGLQVSDIVTAIDGTAVVNIETLSQQISKHKSGDNINLTIIRNGRQEMTITATLQNQNEQF